MTLDPFEAAWQRWERAREHMDACTAAWNDFLGDEHDAFDFDFTGNDAGVFVLRVLQTRPMPPTLSLTFGEWLYNLRSCLDYVVWATACHVAGRIPPPDQSVLQYPIYFDQKTWDLNLYRLGGLHQHHRDMMLLMQPFKSNADANYLGWLNRLARSDRHRSLVTGAARLAVLEPVVQAPRGTTVRVEWGERTVVDGKADAARVTVRPFQFGDDVSINPRVAIDPEVAEWSSSPFWQRIRFGDRMSMIQVFVAAEIAAYEYDCTGKSRKADLVSDEYQKLMDRPRTPLALQDLRRPALKWTSAEDGRPTNRSKFEGRYFPADGPTSPGTHQYDL